MIVYIWGNLTPDNFTPRPSKDTLGRPGQKPGLSASSMIPPGRKAQGVDISKLKPPLAACPDDPSRGGTPGHFSIAPTDKEGEVDIRSLEAWARSRGTNSIHEFTQALLDAVVEPNKGRKQ